MRHLYVPLRRPFEPPSTDPEEQAHRVMRDTQIALADIIEALHQLYYHIPGNPGLAQAIINELGAEHEEPIGQAVARLLASAIPDNSTQAADKPLHDYAGAGEVAG